jgi:hypothetical protein
MYSITAKGKRNRKIKFYKLSLGQPSGAVVEEELSGVASTTDKRIFHYI